MLSAFTHSFTSSPHLRPPERSCKNEGCWDAPPSPLKKKNDTLTELELKWSLGKTLHPFPCGLRGGGWNLDEVAKCSEEILRLHLHGNNKEAFISITNGLDWLIGQECHNGNGHKMVCSGTISATVGKTRVVFSKWGQHSLETWKKHVKKIHSEDDYIYISIHTQTRYVFLQFCVKSCKVFFDASCYFEKVAHSFATPSHYFTRRHYFKITRQPVIVLW